MSKQHNKAPQKRLKVFVSYNSADRDWAEWVAGVLDMSGYQPIIQAWHFRPGENFVLRMHEAASETDFTIAILSEHYLKATFTQPEWAAAFAEGATGKRRKFIPVRVAECKLTGLLSQIIYIDLIGLGESEARQALLDGLKDDVTPRRPPPFPQRDRVATVAQAPFPPTREHSVQYQGKKYVLWRLAYSFLRLDQLPSGGWGKSLPQWMEGIWEGDGGSIIRSPDMRRDGGTDFTCAAYYNYVNFVERFEVGSETYKFCLENEVGTKLVKSLKARIDHDKGMMNTGLQGRTVKPKVNLRHTAMGMISLILYGKSKRASNVVRDELKITASYLNKHLKRWQQDESHVFAMFSALAKLVQLLESQDGIDQFTHFAEKDRRSLISRIHSVLPKIQQEFTNFKEFTPLPENTQTTLMADPFFVPYGRFWRMERSGFLMYLPLLIADNGSQFFGHIQKDGNLTKRFLNCFHEIFQDVKVPFDPHFPELSLLKHHRKAGNVESPRDWGLSAELAALLRKPAIQNLMRTHADYAGGKLDELSVALEASLINTFTGFHQRPDIFKFTQSLSFSRSLDLLHDAEIKSDYVITLDRAITDLLGAGVTEDTLNGFVSDHIFGINSNNDESKGKISPDVASVRDLLLNKLQSGEHTSEDVLCSELIWDERNRKTIEFYNGPGGDDYAKRYGANPVVDYISRLDDMFKQKRLRGLRALDIACGPGQYAVLLKKQGFDVDLYDASVKMLKYAAKRVGKRKPPRTRDYFHLAEECRVDEEYDLIFASAMMVHVPLRFAQSIYQQFYRILKPGGVLFVNYKVGDHSLISLGGRYFQYYRDRERPWAMLRAAGFRIVEVIEQWNNRTSNNLPREIHWVNIFCIKPNASVKDLNFPNCQRVG